MPEQHTMIGAEKFQTPGTTMSKAEGMMNQLAEAMHSAMLKQLQSGNFVSPDYANRFRIPQDFLDSIWAAVDVDRLRAELVARLERDVADRIVNALAAEISTDLKSLLSNAAIRKRIRDVASEHLLQLTEKARTGAENSLTG